MKTLVSITVIYTTYPAVKLKSEKKKMGLNGDRTNDLCDTSTFVHILLQCATELSSQLGAGYIASL